MRPPQQQSVGRSQHPIPILKVLLHRSKQNNTTNMAKGLKGLTSKTIIPKGY